VDLPTGRITHRERLPSTYFAEGLAYTDGRLVLLTWREGIAMRFRLPQAELEGAWRYSGEGWGLTPWRNSLAVSNGSPEIVFRDTTDFRVLRSVTVHDNENRITNLNELETLEESLVANVWGTDWLVRFDPETGVVLEWIDLGPLARRQRKLGTEETNGVAWDARQRRLLVTGKLWNRVYQIRLQRPDGSVWP
jgi:glutamine cyclotransferase